jgi:hypothetical protein
VLHRRGYRLVTDPAHFLLESPLGPLVAGDLDRSVAWASQLAAQMPRGLWPTAYRRTA